MYTVTFDHFNVGHGGYHALTLAVVEEGTLLNLVYVLVQSSTRLVDHIKIQNKQRRRVFHSSWESELKRHIFSFLQKCI